MKLTLSKPVAVAHGPLHEVVDWGPWQFPQLRRAENGDLFASVNLGEDNWEGKGGGINWYVSHDNGDTWSDSNELDAFRAIPAAPNGDRLEASSGGHRSVDPAIFEGHEPVYVLDFDGKPFFDYYKYEDLAEHFDKRVTFKRLRKGGDTVEVFHPDVTDNPGLCVVRPSGRDVVLDNKLFGRLRRAPDGALWQMHYDRGMTDGKFCDTFLAYYYRSDDNGETWSLAATVDPRDTENALFYCEQDIAWIDEKHAISTFRSNGLRVATSDDGGYTWSKSRKIADFGVDPAVCVLKCGAILTTYGRPGFLVMPCFDGKGEKWEEPIEIVPTADNSWKLYDQSKHGNSAEWGTCSYSDIVALSDNEALIVYTDFFYPDDEGVRRKTLMVVKATVEE